MTSRFIVLEHPSDIGILASADSRERALEAAARGVVSVMADPERIAIREDRILRVESADTAGLPILWLTEILYYFDAETMLFSEFTIERWSETEILGRARGERFDSDRHELRTAIKAVTYHQFEVRQTPEGWDIQVFLDI